MPTLSRDVPDDPKGQAFIICRTPAFRPATAIVTSHDMVGCYTHFYRGRTTPHDKHKCAPCLEGLPFRWHSYLTALDCHNNLHFLFEVTRQAAMTFKEYRDHFHTLRGCWYEARRMNAKNNGRVLIKTKPFDLSKIVLPQPPELPRCLEIIWDLPRGTLTVDTIDPDTQTPKMATDGDPQPNPRPEKPIRLRGDIVVIPDGNGEEAA